MRQLEALRGAHIALLGAADAIDQADAAVVLARHLLSVRCVNIVHRACLSIGHVRLEWRLCPLLKVDSDMYMTRTCVVAVWYVCRSLCAHALTSHRLR